MLDFTEFEMRFLQKIIPVFLVMLLSGMGCGGSDISEDSTALLTDELPDQESSPFEITLSSQGIRSAEVVSGYMEYFVERGTYYLKDSVTADFYDVDGNHTSTLTSMRATINEKEDLLFAEENVVVVSDSGATLFTEELYWKKETETIYTEDFVTIITENDTLYGRGLESDRSLRNYRIEQPTGVSHRITGKKK